MNEKKMTVSFVLTEEQLARVLIMLGWFEKEEKKEKKEELPVWLL